MVQAIPEGVSSVVPYLSVRGAMKAIEFYQAAFGAEVMSVMPMGKDLVGHADLRIGGARVYLADEMPAFGALKSPKTLKGSSVNLHFWTEDCDAAFARAVGAGCTVVMPLVDQFWGDRYGMVQDPFGHFWAITSHQEDVSREEMIRRGEEAMAQMPPPPPPKPKPRPKAKKKGLPASVKPAAPAKAEAKPAKAKAAAPAKAAEAVDSKKVKKSKKDKKAKKSKKGKKSKASKKAKTGKKSKKDKKRKKKSKR